MLLSTVPVFFLQDSSEDSDVFDASILQWDGDDIATWLREIGFTQYQVLVC